MPTLSMAAFQVRVTDEPVLLLTDIVLTGSGLELSALVVTVTEGESSERLLSASIANTL